MWISICGMGPIPAGADGLMSCGRKTAKKLRIAICSLGGDPRWCLQRDELLALHERLHLICPAAACQARLQRACIKRLPCSHWCCGLRQEPACLPCLHVSPICNCATRTHGYYFNGCMYSSSAHQESPGGALEWGGGRGGCLCSSLGLCSLSSPTPTTAAASGSFWPHCRVSM